MIIDTNNKKDKPKIRQRIPGKRILISTTETFNTIDIKEPIIKEIGEFADLNNFDVYIIGGYVRDVLLARQRTDLDFTVVGDSIAFAKKLAKKFKTKPVVYDKFKTAMLQTKDFKLEFVGTRKEEYTEDSRKPKVTDGTLEDDIRRRDFTINAMAVCINQDKYGRVVDIFNGKKDLENKIIKTPLEPSVTFSDDPLRMLRAARFATQLDFEIETRTMLAMKSMAQRIEIISQERITEELLKILAAQKPSKGILILYETNLLSYIFPELARLAGVEIVQEGKLEFAHKDVLIHSLKVLDKVAEQTDNIWLRFAALIHDIAKPISKRFAEGTGWTFHGHEEVGARMVNNIFRKMKLPLEHVEYVERIVRLHQRPMALVDDGVTDSAIRRLAFHAGDALQDLFTVCRADITTKNPELNFRYLNNYEKVFRKVTTVQEKDKLREFQSPVRGEEIMEVCSIPPSKAVGVIKTIIEEAILDGIIPNEYEPAKNYFLKNWKQWLDNYNREDFLTKTD